METTDEDDQFDLSIYPFITWNINEVIADIIEQSTQQFPPDDKMELNNIARDIQVVYKNFSTECLISSSEDMIRSIKQYRTEQSDYYKEESGNLTSETHNYFGGATPNDSILYHYSMILLCDRLLNEGFTVNHKKGTEKLPQVKTFNDLFINPADIKPCVDVLNNYENSRNRGGEFKKFVVVAWIDYLESINKIYTCKYESVAPALATEFEGWKVGRRTWYEHANGYEHAKKYFIMNIPH